MNPMQLQNDKIFVHHVVFEYIEMKLYLMKVLHHQIHHMYNHVDYEFDLFEEQKIIR